jgi:hypothetical protein
LSPKGKNVDICYFYAFLMLEEKDLKFASRQLEDGVGASAGFGTVGGGARAAKKRLHQDAVLTDLQHFTRKLSDSAVGIRSGTERALSRLFLSPSPTFSDISNTAAGTAAVAAAHASGDSYSQRSSYSSAKEEKIIME